MSVPKVFCSELCPTQHPFDFPDTEPLVLLSGITASRSEEVVESKDPYIHREPGPVLGDGID